MFGGVAIALTTLALGITMGPDARVWQLLGCGAAIAVFGFIDDLLSLNERLPRQGDMVRHDHCRAQVAVLAGPGSPRR